MAMTSRGVHLAEFVVETCDRCGIAFCMTADIQNSRVRDGNTFYCTNGHGQRYESYGESTEKKLQELRDELERKKSTIRILAATNETTERRRRAAAGVATKRKKKLDRVANGVCPCCNRTFQNLARHMKGQHPEFGG